MEHKSVSEQVEVGQTMLDHVADETLLAQLFQSNRDARRGIRDRNFKEHRVRNHGLGGLS